MQGGEESSTSEGGSDSAGSNGADEASLPLISRGNSMEASCDSITSSEDGTKAETGYTKAQIIILVSICIGQFFTDACIALPAPFLPQKDEQHNIKEDVTGWIIGLSPLLQLICCPIFGRLLPHVGLHSTFTLGLFFSGGSTVLFGMLDLLSPRSSESGIDYTYLVLAFLLRGTQAIGGAAFNTASMTLISITFPKNTTTVLSIVELVIGLGVMGGPAIGSGLYILGGFKLVFVGIGTVILVSSVVFYFALPITVGDMPQDEKADSVLSVLKDMKIIAAMVLGAYSGIIWSSMDPILEPELRNKYGLSQSISALSFLLLSVCYAISAPIVGKSLDSFQCMDSLWVMVIGFSVHGVNFLLAGPTPWLPSLERPLWLLLCCLAVMGLSLGMVIVPSLDMVFQSDDDEEETNPATLSMISGMWSSAYAFGDFVGPSFSGMMTEYKGFGYTMTYYSMGCLLMIIFILCIKIHRKCKKYQRSHRSKTNPIKTSSLYHGAIDENSPLLFTSVSRSYNGINNSALMV